MEELRVLNPQYRKDEIPGDIRPYALTLPSQQIYSYIVSEDSIVAHNAALYARRDVVVPVDPSTVSNDDGETTTKLVVKYHKVRRNETISMVARKYGVSVSSIKKWNGLRSSRLKRGQTLKINTYTKVRVEQPETEEEETVDVEETVVAETTPVAAPEKKKKETATTTTAPRNPERHKVQRGETLASIAGQYGVTIADIREWNDLKSNNIMAGQVLVVDAKKAVKKKNDTPAAPAVHIVKSGENLSAIADKYGVSVANLREWNDLKSDNIRVGDKLKLKADGKTSTSSRSRDNEAAEQTHKVKRGETLGQIATKYGVTVDDLRKWNNIKGNNIAAGQNLKVYSDKKVDRKTDKTDKTSKKKQKTHKVKRGETLGEIAEKYGVGLSKLKKANGIKGNNIQIGQSLKIPQ